jgi:thioredoxin reductase (NADPH)
MKKPLILLVDDDRAVLEALETTLDPLFGEICRIEAFAEPVEALDATARWAKEGRPLALAIVDQKMPGMTGVELLGRLRAAHSSTLSLSLWF